MEPIEELVDVLRGIDLAVVDRFATAIVECVKKRGVLYLFGNGGSAAIAQHFALDLERLAESSPRIRATCLGANSTRLTADGNDYGFEYVFSRQLEAYVAPNDIALAISASGASANVLQALNVARSHGILTLGLTRSDGRPVARLCEIVLEVPARIPSLLETAFSCVLYLVTNRVRTLVRAEQKAERGIAHGSKAK